jgi:hypothetical protein
LHHRPYQPSAWIITDIDLGSIDTPNHPKPKSN